MPDDDLVTDQGVDTAPEPAEEPDPAAPAGVLPDEPPASPVPPVPGRTDGPGQELEEGEGDGVPALWKRGARGRPGAPRRAPA